MHEERIQPGHGARLGEAGIVRDQRFLPVQQPELRADTRVGHGGTVRGAERTQQHAHAPLQEPVLVGRQEARPQHRAERAFPEEEAATAQLVIELRLRLAGQLVRQQAVVMVDRVVQRHASHPCRRPAVTACAPR